MSLSRWFCLLEMNNRIIIVLRIYCTLNLLYMSASARIESHQPLAELIWIQVLRASAINIMGNHSHCLA